jgi:hypothetical protein
MDKDMAAPLIKRIGVQRPLTGAKRQRAQLLRGANIGCAFG